MGRGYMHQAVNHQAHMPVQVPGLVEKRPHLIICDIVYLRQVPAGTYLLQDLQDASAQQILSSQPFKGRHLFILPSLCVLHSVMTDM